MRIKKDRPLKRFGQNYLVDNNIARKIINEFNAKNDDVIIEIGPGNGALTSELQKITGNLVAIEIDNRKIKTLQNDFPCVKIINKDFLKTDIKEFYEKKKIKIIGNIPYNITSSILFKCIENKDKISDAVFMVQYEVAKRIIAEPGTKDYGILSVILNYFADVKFCFKVSPNVFYPKPKVYSGIIHLYFNKRNSDDLNEKLFMKIVKSAFGNRRKNLKNSLSNSIFKDYDFSELAHYLKLRAEQLHVDDFIRLTKLVQNQDDR